jgi:carboxyl-terminal processing protease
MMEEFFSTVVDIAGLFIEQGPLFKLNQQEERRKCCMIVIKDQYDGPLVIMVNSFFSFSFRILAAAIQDYKRGIIIGSKPMVKGLFKT